MTPVAPRSLIRPGSLWFFFFSNFLVVTSVEGLARVPVAASVNAASRQSHLQSSASADVEVTAADSVEQREFANVRRVVVPADAEHFESGFEAGEELSEEGLEDAELTHTNETLGRRALLSTRSEVQGSTVKLVLGGVGDCQKGKEDTFYRPGYLKRLRCYMVGKAEVCEECLGSDDCWFGKGSTCDGSIDKRSMDIKASSGKYTRFINKAFICRPGGASKKVSLKAEKLSQSSGELRFYWDGQLISKGKGDFEKTWDRLGKGAHELTIEFVPAKKGAHAKIGALTYYYDSEDMPCKEDGKRCFLRLGKDPELQAFSSKQLSCLRAAQPLGVCLEWRNCLGPAKITVMKRTLSVGQDPADPLGLLQEQDTGNENNGFDGHGLEDDLKEGQDDDEEDSDNIEDEEVAEEEEEDEEEADAEALAEGGAGEDEETEDATNLEDRRRRRRRRRRRKAAKPAPQPAPPPPTHAPQPAPPQPAPTPVASQSTPLANSWSACRISAASQKSDAKTCFDPQRQDASELACASVEQWIKDCRRLCPSTPEDTCLRSFACLNGCVCSSWRMCACKPQYVDAQCHSQVETVSLLQRKDQALQSDEALEQRASRHSANESMLWSKSNAISSFDLGLQAKCYD